MNLVKLCFEISYCTKFMAFIYKLTYDDLLLFLDNSRDKNGSYDVT